MTTKPNWKARAQQALAAKDAPVRGGTPAHKQAQDALNKHMAEALVRVQANVSRLAEAQLAKIEPPKPQHGGKRPGAGRKPLAEGEDSTIINARVTKTQAEKFKRIGGAAWLRPAIDKAREPKG